MIISNELALLYGKLRLVFPNTNTPLLPSIALELPIAIVEIPVFIIWISPIGFAVPIPIELKDPIPTVILGVPVNPCAFVAVVAVSALPVKAPLKVVAVRSEEPKSELQSR